ncbi:hypothetical protein BQ8794_50496 [Mesorhizobium prunaredense]|uniref:Uncharacterized protein n=1 Tax=Mesorhizobium prunaredense TaxID=1631249 RepID=A0A1R3VEZ6_9HYPH|nr:hypothetical protein BQ8794_50496 [Mesorhizobium prunaredense]
MDDFRNRFHVRARFLRSSAIEDAEVLCECPLPTQNDTTYPQAAGVNDGSSPPIRTFDVVRLNGR